MDRRLLAPFWRAGLIAGLLATSAPAARASVGEGGFAPVISQVQPKIVKIYGAGGLRGLESYQSGFLISAEGHVLTAASTVLDSDVVTVVLDSGRRLEAKEVGVDPTLEIAVLKVDASDLPYFDLAEAPEADIAVRVLAFSNLFGVATGNEPASVQHGAVSVVTKLDARRGAAATRYRGPILVLDAMTNNPGAAGGALTDVQGRLLGMLGKEVRSSLTNTWLNYALPASELRPAVERILAGQSAPPPQANLAREDALELSALGLVLMPEVLDRTPPYVDAVRPGSPAAKAGLLPDDLIVFAEGELTPSVRAVQAVLARVDRGQRLRLTVSRGQDLIEVTLEPPAPQDL
ncbi:MAG: S1C family serine protease [Pirellulales bacterium]